MVISYNYHILPWIQGCINPVTCHSTPVGTSRHRAALLGSPRPGSSCGSALPSGRYPALGRHMETPRVPRSTQKGAEGDQWCVVVVAVVVVLVVFWWWWWYNKNTSTKTMIGTVMNNKQTPSLNSPFDVRTFLRSAASPPALLSTVAMTLQYLVYSRSSFQW